MKELIDTITNQITSIFFTFYMIFLIPTYLLNNVSNIYEFVMNDLKAALSTSGFWNNSSLGSLNASKTDIKNLQAILDKEVFKYYKLLEGYDGYFTNIIKLLMKNIFIEESPYLKDIKKEIRKISGNSVDFDKEEDNINITSCSYAMNITTYAIFLGIVYLLLSMAFPDSKAIVIILFIIILLIVIYCMYQTFSFKLAIGNFKFMKATIEYINNSSFKSIERNSKKITKEFKEHITAGFQPIKQIPIIGPILGPLLNSISNSSNVSDFKDIPALTKVIEKQVASVST